MTTTLIDHAPAVILDSNALFDWMLFEDPACAALGADILSHRVAWIATASMLQEADTVLARGMLDAWSHRHDALRERRAAWVRVVPEPMVSSATPRCTDPDDQKFINLALAWPGSLLVTRDKALLKLRSRAARHGVRICRPAEWALASPPYANDGANWPDNRAKLFFEEGHPT